MITVILDDIYNKEKPLTKVRDFKNFDLVLKYISKYQKRYGYNKRYRIRLITYDKDDINFIIDKFMGEDYKKYKDGTSDIELELTFDMNPVIMMIDGKDYFYHDFHQDCLDLKQYDIVYSYKEDKYFIITGDPDKYAIEYASKDVYNDTPDDMISRMDLRKASEFEIEEYELDKIRDSFINCETEEEFDEYVSEIIKKHPYLAK